MLRLNIFTSGAQVIERVGECGSTIHLRSRTSPSSIYLEDEDGRQVDFNYFEVPSNYLEVLGSDELRRMTLSYMISSLSWECNSIAVLDGNTLLFTSNAVIVKSGDLLGKNIVADVSVVNSSPSVGQGTYRAKVVPEARMMVASAVPVSRDEGDDIGEISLEDNRFFDIGRLTIGDYMSLAIVEFSTETVKCYTHTVGKEGTMFGFEFVATDFIPACQCRFYEKDTVRYIGSSQLKELQRGDDTVALIGTSTVVTCKSVVERSGEDEGEVQQMQQAQQSKSVHHPIFVTIDERITLLFKNRSENEVGALVKVKHYVGDAEIINVSYEVKKRERGYVTWEFDVPYGKTKMVINLRLRRMR